LHKSSAVAEMGDRLATTDVGRKVGGCCALCPFPWGELGPYLTQCRLAEAYFRTKWHLDLSSRLATTNIGRKLGRVVPSPFFGSEKELGTHLTQCGLGRCLPPCQVASSSIQPFGQNTPTSQTGQTGPDRQDRQRSDSVGRTVLQTVAQ